MKNDNEGKEQKYMTNIANVLLLLHLFHLWKVYTYKSKNNVDREARVDRQAGS